MCALTEWLFLDRLTLFGQTGTVAHFTNSLALGSCHIPPWRWFLWIFIRSHCGEVITLSYCTVVYFRHFHISLVQMTRFLSISQVRRLTLKRIIVTHSIFVLLFSWALYCTKCQIVVVQHLAVVCKDFLNDFLRCRFRQELNYTPNGDISYLQ